jgi:predicted acetyltransferase
MSESEFAELRRVDESERGDLYDLVDDYLHELSTHREIPVGPIDAAGYTYLHLYWKEAGRHPFFILSSDTRVGFVLIREVESEDVIEMSDFYIRPLSRRAGLGRAALTRVWHRFPGRWRLQVHPLNHAAFSFWPRLIEEFAVGTIDSRGVVEEDGRRHEFNFEIPFDNT